MADKEPSQPSQPTKPFDINDKSTYPLPTCEREPNFIGLDGHEFRINGDVPSHITEAFYELHDRDARGCSGGAEKV